MTTYKVGYFVGSLPTASINRELAMELTKLTPRSLEFTEISFKDHRRGYKTAVLPGLSSAIIGTT